MSTPVATYIEPIVGWRCWRVLPLQTLSAGKRYRLCAAGTRGAPKVWEPQQTFVAKCSAFESQHEAPHRRHECGLYGFTSREDAERALAQLVPTNGRPGVSWAFGRVSLWGRIIECELGWRAQYAYPYDITVFTNGAGVGPAIATEYAIDVESKRRSDLRAIIAQHPPDYDGYAEPVVQTIGGTVRKQWYETSIYGGMDEYFLKPYHEEICQRLDKLATSISRLEHSADVEGGRDDA